MTLNSSGPISLGGSTSGQSINLELGQSATAQISLNDTNVRSLAAVPSGAIVVPTNFYGKSSVVVNFTDDTVDAGNTGAAANAAYRIDSDGNVYFGVNGTFTSQYAWVSPTSQASNYEVYATFIDGGSFTSGTFDAWVALSSDQTWNMRQATIGSSFGEIFFDVRRIGTTTSLDTWTVQFFAERAT
jgi:hypothetical protein